VPSVSLPLSIDLMCYGASLDSSLIYYQSVAVKEKTGLLMHRSNPSARKYRYSDDISRVNPFWKGDSGHGVLRLSRSISRRRGETPAGAGSRQFKLG